MNNLIGIAILTSTLLGNNISLKENIRFCQEFQCSIKISQKKQTWGVVFHAAESLSSAQNESNRVKNIIHYNSSIFRCNNWYRGVFVSSSRRQAVQLLAESQSKIRNDAYVVDLSIWCPGKQIIKS